MTGAIQNADLALSNDPYSMNDTGDVAEQCQQNIQPERTSKPYLEKDPQRGEQNCNDYSDQVHDEHSQEVRLIF